MADFVLEDGILRLEMSQLIDSFKCHTLDTMNIHGSGFNQVTIAAIVFVELIQLSYVHLAEFVTLSLKHVCVMNGTQMNPAPRDVSSGE